MAAPVLRDSAIVVIPPTSSSTSAPTAGTTGIYVPMSRVRTLVDYSGTVTSCALTIWFRDQGTGIWYEGAATDDLDPLTPGGATPVNEAREWDVGLQQEVFFQVTAIAGGGTVAVRLQGIRE